MGDEDIPLMGGKDVPLRLQFKAALRFAVSDSAGFLSCLLYTSPSPRDLSTSRMPSSA